MTDYFWDFAVDENAALHPCDQSQFYLQNGFCDETRPAAPVGLLPGERIQLRVFDVTHIDGQPSAFTLERGSFTLRRAVINQSSLYPFTDNQAIPFGDVSGESSPLRTEDEAVIKFSGPVTSSHQETSRIFSGATHIEFPVWNVVASPGLEIAHAGRYLLTAEVTVKKESQDERKFRVDPEMIVEGVG
jgi:hypothetical protein